MIHHEIFMGRCLELARLGLGKARPNPLVGSVIVFENTIIGEGFHAYYGGPHAEVNAVASVKDPSLLRESTVYVSLEPCAHHGKTPPCADMLVRLGVKKVVIGMQDPFPLVAGKGIQRLKDAGIEVICGILEDECRELNKRFLTFHEKKRPFILLKWARSADDIIGSGTEERLVLTGKITQRLVHKWRSEEAAILVGPGTALLDKPRLNVRYWEGNDPVKIILDRHLRIPLDNPVYTGETRVLVFNLTTDKKEGNITFIALPAEDFLTAVLKHLYTLNIQSILVEGGSMILQEFIRLGCWDEARVIEVKENFFSGVHSPEIEGQPWKKERLENGTISWYRNGSIGHHFGV